MQASSSFSISWSLRDLDLLLLLLLLIATLLLLPGLKCDNSIVVMPIFVAGVDMGTIAAASVVEEGAAAAASISVLGTAPYDLSSPSEVLLPGAAVSRALQGYEIELRELSYRVVKPVENGTKLKSLLRSCNFFEAGLTSGRNCTSSKEKAAATAARVSTRYIHLLKNVSFVARPGEVLAIAGPSGAGKSTLLDVVAGRIRPSSPPTSLLVNQLAMEVPQFRRISGYVMQDDALFPMLTVEETLLYSARLRLPASVSMTEKLERVRATMEDLGLSHVARSRVGDQLSGGERRRVSIGIDVIHDPAVLLLDEPTSSLDSTSALHVVTMLRKMAVTHMRTVILSIHQPGFRILEHLHSIVLLAHGEVVHHGSLEHLHSMLMASGHDIPEQINVLEYAIDLIDTSSDHSHDHSTSCDDSKFSHVDRSNASIPWLQKGLTGDEQEMIGQSPTPSTASCLIMSCKPGSTRCSRGGEEETSHLAPLTRCAFANSSLQEIAVLTHRFSKNVYRTRQLFRSRTLYALIAGVCLGNVFSRMGYGMRGFTERYGFLAFSVTLMLTSTVELLPSLLEECKILAREASRGAYRMSSWVVSNTLVFLPFLFLNAALFSLPVYWMVGLAPQASAFFFFLLVFWLLLVVAHAYVSFFGVLVRSNSYQLAYSLTMAGFGASWLFSGFFISKRNMPNYWLFMHYLSLYKYPLESLLINEFSHVSDKCFSTGTSIFPDGPCSLTGSEVLMQQGLIAETPGAHRSNVKWVDVGTMVGFALLYRILSFFVLRFKMQRRHR